jgi:hypothetical protein
MKKLNKKHPDKVKDNNKSFDKPEISSEFKKELERVRKEVKSGKYVVYKTLEEMRKDISP